MFFGRINDDLELRQQMATDDPFIRNLFAATRAQDFYGTGLPQASIAQLLLGQFDAQSLSLTSQHPTAHRAIIQLKNADIGRLYWDHSSSQVHILELEILPDRQGQGIGTVLLSFICNATHASGCALTLSVAKHNPAQNLYSRLGFRRTGDTGTHWKMDCPKPAS